MPDLTGAPCCRQDSFPGAVHAGAPAANCTENMAAYGWLSGVWQLDAIELLDDGVQRRHPGEWHCG